MASETMKRGKSWYMHTLEGRPAYYDGDQLVFLARSNNARPLVPDIHTIYNQQRSSTRHRALRGDTEALQHGYIRFPR